MSKKERKSGETEHSMFSNILFILGVMFKLSPALVIGELVNGIIRILPGRLVSVVGIKYIIDVVTSGERLERIYYAVGLIAAFVFHTYLGVLSWVGVVIFSLYIGYDWARANTCAPTLDNAVDLAANLYLDIINLFLRILSLLGKRRR